MQPEPERILTVPSEIGDSISPVVTGNDWIALPDISPFDAGIARVNLVHMGSRGLIEWVGNTGAPEATAEASVDRSGAANRRPRPFLLPFVEDETGRRWELSAALKWTYVESWIPRGSALMHTPDGDELSLTLTICPSIEERGCYFMFELHHLAAADGSASRRLAVGLEGLWGSTLSTVFRSRTMHVAKHVDYSSWTNSLVLEARGETSLAALALSSDLGFDWWVKPREGGEIDFGLRTRVELSAGERIRVAFVLAANADPDGAGATSVHLRRVGAWEALNDTAKWLSKRSYAARPEESSSKVLSRANRNLHFCRFYAHARAIDTEELVMLTSRSHRYYVSAAFWPRDAFLWAFPAMLASDARFAREILLTGFARHARNMGIHAHYISGAVLYPGFELDQLASYIIALGSFVDTTGDESVLDEPCIGAGIAKFAECLEQQRDPDVALYRTFLDPSDDPVRYPYLTYDNVLIWKSLTILSRLARLRAGSSSGDHWEAAARDTREAIINHCIIDGPCGRMFAWSTDLRAASEVYDDPPGSLLLLPYYGFVSADDPTFLNTVAFITSDHNTYRSTDGQYHGAGCAHSRRPWPMHACNLVLSGLHDEESLKLLKEAPLDGGLACETIYCDTGKPATGAAFASFAGYLSVALARLGGVVFRRP
ncbi:MAG: glycoside hydrolase family 125 protein [Clostridia bacterium]|nr:glycoside hydrolase family 125 protein [Clostridia bacterium]